MFNDTAMKNQLLNLILMTTLIAQILAASGCQKPDSGTVPATGSVAEIPARSFEFNYGATIVGLPAGADVRVWFPIAETNGQQDVHLISSSTPATMQTNRDEKYGNQIGFFETKTSDQQEIEFGFALDVVRTEAGVADVEAELTDEQKQNFLRANSMVPIDGKPQELIKEVQLPSEPMAAGKALYNVVEEHMKYDKSNPGYGKGDAVWACDSKTGNCTDFHSLFISLARSQSIPARFEIGFPLPADQQQGTIGGYHCWAWFHSEGNGWLPVDISEADKHPELKDYYFGKLTADRISFSTGRDIELVPKSENGALNYFVYPVVEVDGKRWPKDKIKLQFSFKDKQ